VKYSAHDAGLPFGGFDEIVDQPLRDKLPKLLEELERKQKQSKR